MVDDARARTYRPTPLSEFLRKYREEHHLTQEELAIKIGRARTALAGWEFGRGISTINRDNIAKKLGVKAELLGPAWDPTLPRSDYRRRNIDTARAERAHFPSDSDVTDPLRSALPQHLGRSVDVAGYPDPDLLDRLLGLWRALPTVEARQSVFNCAVRELQLMGTTPEARSGQRRHG